METFKERLFNVLIPFMIAFYIVLILIYTLTGFFIIDTIYYLITGKSVYNYLTE